MALTLLRFRALQQRKLVAAGFGPNGFEKLERSLLIFKAEPTECPINALAEVHAQLVLHYGVFDLADTAKQHVSAFNFIVEDYLDHRTGCSIEPDPLNRSGEVAGQLRERPKRDLTVLDFVKVLSIRLNDREQFASNVFGFDLAALGEFGL